MTKFILNKMHASRIAEIILEIENVCFSHPYTIGMIEEEVLNKNSIILFADEEGNVSMAENSADENNIPGYCLAACIPSENTAELLRIAVKPDFQKHGTGTRLMKVLEDICSDRQIDRILLEVSENNHRAIRLYESSGYTRYRIRKNYYTDGSDAVMYEKKIIIRRR